MLRPLSINPPAPADPVPRAPRPPALTTLAIVGIPVGMLCVLACVLLSLALGLPPARNNPGELALRGDRLITIWNWAGTIGTGVIAGLILLGSIDCLRDQPSGPKLLMASAWAGIAFWLLAVLIWIVYAPMVISMAMFDRNAGTGASSPPDGSNALAWFISVMSYRTLLTWAWAAAVWSTLRARRRRRLDDASNGADDNSNAGTAPTAAMLLAVPPAADAGLQYRSVRGTGAAAAEQLVATPALARLLYLGGW